MAQRIASIAAAKDCALADTAIVDSGTGGWYFKTGAPVSDIDQAAANIRVGTSTGQIEESAASCKLPLSVIPPELFGHEQRPPQPVGNW